VLGGVFISYRRDDSSGFARGIYDRLAKRLGRKSVFFDVDNIELGEDFVDVLSERVGKCNALVAVIGASWCSSADARNQRRLDHPHDFVRIEIEAALERNIRVIPVLVDGASMPRPEDLPDSLKKLARRQGIEVSHTHFDSDVKKLTRTLSLMLEELRQREEAAALGLAEVEAARQADAQRQAEDAAETKLVGREERERLADQERRESEAAEAAREEREKRQAASAEMANRRAALADTARRAEEERRARDKTQAETQRGAEERRAEETAEAERVAREERERQQAAEASLAEELRGRREAAEAERQKRERQKAADAARAEEERRLAEAEAAGRAEEERRAKETAEAESAAREEREQRQAAEVTRAEETRLAAEAEAARRAEEERQTKEALEAERIAREKRQAPEAAEGRRLVQVETARRAEEERSASEVAEVERVARAESERSRATQAAQKTDEERYARLGAEAVHDAHEKREATRASEADAASARKSDGVATANEIVNDVRRLHASAPPVVGTGSRHRRLVAVVASIAAVGAIAFWTVRLGWHQETTPALANNPPASSTNNFFTISPAASTTPKSEVASQPRATPAQQLGMSEGSDAYVKKYPQNLKAAEQGNMVTQYELGFFYEDGFGGIADNAKAIAWYKKSAAQGYEPAQAALNRLQAK
jgi:hypothetical protein